MTKRFRPRHLLPLLILVLAGALAVTVFHNFHRTEPEQVADPLPPNVDLSMKRIDYTETRNGVRRWTLQADSANRSADQRVARIKNIRMVFFDEKGAQKATLTARSGEMDTVTHEVKTRGDVVVKSPRGMAFYTDRLQYREKGRLIYGTDPVRLVSPNMEITGKGFRFHLQNDTFQILSGVRARLEGVVKG